MSRGKKGMFIVEVDDLRKIVYSVQLITANFRNIDFTNAILIRDNYHNYDTLIEHLVIVAKNNGYYINFYHLYGAYVPDMLFYDRSSIINPVKKFYHGKIGDL